MADFAELHQRHIEREESELRPMAAPPESAYFADQTAEFSAQRWVKLPFSDAEIQADTKVGKITLKE